MMLAQKAWRESSARFGVSALALIWICLILVVLQPGHASILDEASYAPYIRHAFFEGFTREMFLVFALILGHGGLLQERTRGTASFTLALPVSRTRLVAVRAGVGAAEVAALALLPALTLVAVSSLVHRSYPLADALRFSVLWTDTGVLVFSTTFLLSTVLPGEYSAPIVCVGVLLLYEAVIALTPLHRMPSLNMFALMNLEGPVPWTRLGAIAVVAAALIAAGSYLTSHQDY